MPRKIGQYVEWRKTMRKSLKKILSMMLIFATTSMLFYGCGSDSKKENSVRQGTMTTGFAVLMHEANVSGEYEEAGLSVSEHYFDNGPAINEGIAAGDIDVATIGAMPAITGNIANGSRVVAILADDEESVQIYARNDSDIVKEGKGKVEKYPNIYGTANQWKGKKVVCAKGTSSHYTLLAVLETMGLSEKDIELINMEGATGASAFEAGTGDIFVGFDPQWAKFYENSDEYTCIAKCSDTDKKLFDVIIATDDFCNNHPDELTNILKAILKQEKKYIDDLDSYKNKMYEWQNEYGECSREFAAYSAKIKPILSVEEQLKRFNNENGISQAEQVMLEIADFMVKNSIIDKKDIEDLIENKLIDSSFIEKAAEGLE